jgi:hypothetical protein
MQVTVKRSAQLAADAASVWRRIGDFARLDAWHPAVAACVLEPGGGAPVRKLTTVDGAVLRERLIAASQADMTYSYSILDGPLPVADYQATLSVAPAGGGSVVVWTSTFRARGATDEAAAGVIGGIYEAGLKALG